MTQFSKSHCRRQGVILVVSSAAPKRLRSLGDTLALELLAPDQLALALRCQPINHGWDLVAPVQTAGAGNLTALPHSRAV